MTSTHVSADWADRLRKTGFRATGVRIATLEHLDQHPHSSADEILRGILTSLPGTSIQAVHNVVNDLTAADLIRRIDLEGSKSSHYETRTHDNHHHVQCIHCGRIADVDCAVGHAPCLQPSDSHGMRVIEASLTFRGICKECERKES